MEKHLHIIAITIPYPANFGGVIDLYWKLPALQKQGIKIHLHCFEYDRKPAHELEEFCEEVCYYKRNQNLLQLLHHKPFIVESRKNEVLHKKLLQDSYPILIEGIHCSYLLNDKRFANRKTILRLHNVEYEYYHFLSITATNIFKKWYCARESKLLKLYEQKIASLQKTILAVTNKDVLTYTSQLGSKTTTFLPLFLPDDWKINIPTGLGSYCLYNGDLSISANQKAVQWLLEHVFIKTKIPLVIAGKNPPKWLINLAYKQTHTCIVANPSQNEMQELIAKAQLNLLPSHSSAGIKLKLLNALFNGRHCLANPETYEGSGVENLCIPFNSGTSCIERIEQYFYIPFVEKEIIQRKKVLTALFNNEENAMKLISYFN